MGRGDTPDEAIVGGPFTLYDAGMIEASPGWGLPFEIQRRRRPAPLPRYGEEALPEERPGFEILGGGVVAMPTVETTFENEMVVPSAAGVQTYYIPIGNYFFDGAGESTLDLDTGSGFQPQRFGVAYVHKRRSSAPATVADDGIGFTFQSAVAAGWTFRFRWKTRKVIFEPSPVAKVRVIGGVLQNGVSWQANSPNAPNGIRVPALKGYQVEFWRQTRKNGGASGTPLPRGGRRYVPYFRGAVDQFIFQRQEFFPAPVTSNRRRFRVAYYNPTTHARSALSQDTIVVCADTAADGVNGRAPVRRQGSVWIE